MTRLVSREAYFLDRKQWDDWLDLFTKDVVYWAPTWATEEELTTDPGNELSLIYIRGRAGLEDRIFRIRSGDSMASVPADRTVHVVGSVLVHSYSDDRVEASASWLTHSYGNRGVMTLGGHYDYSLVRTDAGLRISRKRIILVDDAIAGPVDIYHL